MIIYKRLICRKLKQTIRNFWRSYSDKNCLFCNKPDWTTVEPVLATTCHTNKPLIRRRLIPVIWIYPSWNSTDNNRNADKTLSAFFGQSVWIATAKTFSTTFTLMRTSRHYGQLCCPVRECTRPRWTKLIALTIDRIRWVLLSMTIKNHALIFRITLLFIISCITALALY